jgi:hypothetical protein
MRAAVGKGRVATQGPVEFTASAEPSCQTQTFRNCGDEASCLFTESRATRGERASEQDSMLCRRREQKGKDRKMRSVRKWDEAWILLQGWGLLSISDLQSDLPHEERAADLADLVLLVSKRKIAAAGHLYENVS